MVSVEGTARPPRGPSGSGVPFLQPPGIAASGVLLLIGSSGPERERGAPPLDGRRRVRGAVRDRRIRAEAEGLPGGGRSRPRLELLQGLGGIGEAAPPAHEPV